MKAIAQRAEDETRNFDKRKSIASTRSISTADYRERESIKDRL